MSPSLETLADRLDNLERRHRRLKMGFGGLLLVLLVFGGWTGYRALMGFWHPNTMTQRVYLFDQSPFSFTDAAYMKMGGAIYDPPKFRYWGGIGTRRNYKTGDIEGAAVTLNNQKNHHAAMNVNERGAFLTLSDSTNVVYLGPGLYNDRQLLLELISHDGKQGLRLGLNGNQQPIFEVIREGQTTSLLDPSLTTPARTTSH
jgi:hypothetical protein